MEFPELTDIEYLTYKQVGEKVSNFAGNLIELAGLKKGDKIGIYLDTCMEWQVVAQACYRHGIILCTCYANLGEDSLIHVVKECELDTMIVGSNIVKNLERLKDQFSKLKRLIIVRDQTDDKPLSSSVFEFETYDNLIKPGKPEPILPDIDPEDICVIMYTSGSTGVPKGVIVPNRGLLSCAGAASEELKITEVDVYIGYLPLAHILELVSESAFLLRGGSIGYGSSRTLNAKGVGPLNDPNRKGDLEVVRPTMMAGVPRVVSIIIFIKLWMSFDRFEYLIF